MNKQKLTLALLLVFTTAMSVLADGEQHQGNRSIIEILYDAFGNIIGYIYGA